MRPRGSTGAYVEEPLVPALLYVTVAGMAGSIIARKSNFVFRFLSPLALALGASAYCIPRTTNNVLHGLRTYDYREMTREWQHKYEHAKSTVVGTTHSLTNVAGSVATGAKDAVHDLSDKTSEMKEKTEKVLTEAKDKTVEVAQEVKEKGQGAVKEMKNKGQDVANEVKVKGQDVANEVKVKSKDMGNRFENAKDQVKDQVEDKADSTKDWWNAQKGQAERSAKDFKRSARQSGEHARDWAEDTAEDTHDWMREKKARLGQHGYDRDDVEHGFDKLRNKARQSWDSARDEAQDEWPHADARRREMGRDFKDYGRDMRRGAENMKDQAQDWVQDRSHEMRDRYEDMKDRGQDWVQDRRHDFERKGREAEGEYDHARTEAKRRGRNAWDRTEDRARDAGHDLRDRAEDMQDRGRRGVRKFEDEWDNARSRSRSGEHGAGSGAGWGFTGRSGEDNGNRRGRYEERDDHDGRRFSDSEAPRRSVTEAAREGKHWWQNKNPSDSYESYDNSRPSSGTQSSWWKAGSDSKEQAKSEFGHAKNHAQRGMGHFKDSVEEKAQGGRAWFEDKTNEAKHRFENGKKQAEHELHDKFGRSGAGYRGEQGRDFGGLDRDHGSVYSQDNWFHYDRGQDNRASADRGRERGM
ncbi:hypothetical protein BC939DRAFT_449273 [Gamsiella multidivaricata]|uniref:uncharacterized protein n=1 Tax=Gamsiella multidivaricata TaxID=101098 RepID=UPI002220677B|nr:uncharacterized protein BC939DRAFT_449273 [Gamsiella multidivaricata]KAI7824803.1 hypothetical protein BC939DRAFT_449273 [Gamsiella multidivaricata]